MWISLSPTSLAETYSPEDSFYPLFSSAAYFFSLTSPWRAPGVVSFFFLSQMWTIILAPVNCSSGTAVFSLPPCLYYYSSRRSSLSRRDICSWTFTSYLTPLILSASLIPLGIKILLLQVFHSVTFHFQ